MGHVKLTNCPNLKIDVINQSFLLKLQSLSGWACYRWAIWGSGLADVNCFPLLILLLLAPFGLGLRRQLCCSCTHIISMAKIGFTGSWLWRVEGLTRGFCQVWTHQKSPTRVGSHHQDLEATKEVTHPSLWFLKWPS